MKKSEWIIKVLQRSSGIKLPVELRHYIDLYAGIKNLNIHVGDCVTTSITTGRTGMFWVQDGKEIEDSTKLDVNKIALEMWNWLGDKQGFYVFLYKPKNHKPKTKIIYGIRTTDDEYGRSSIKAYCNNYKIALRESKKHYNWYCGTPVGKAGIEAIEIIVE